MNKMHHIKEKMRTDSAFGLGDTEAEAEVTLGFGDELP
jgi:hypothetical protein